MAYMDMVNGLLTGPCGYWRDADIGQLIQWHWDWVQTWMMLRADADDAVKGGGCCVRAWK